MNLKFFMTGILSVMFGVGALTQGFAADKKVKNTQDSDIVASKFIHIGVVGDVMAAGVAQALDRQMSKFKQLKFEPLNFAKGSSGFVRDDYYDWNANLPAILAANKMDYLVVFMGSNDRQSMRVNGRSQKPKSMIWREEYIHRIDQFLDETRKHNIKVIWLGQAISRGKSFSADMAVFNEIYRQRVDIKAGNYLDLWAMFTNENGKYTRNGADNNGQVRKLRSSNGIHFTKRGYDKIAFQTLDLIHSLHTAGGKSSSNSDVGEEVFFEIYDNLSDDGLKDGLFVQRKDVKIVKTQAELDADKNIFELDDGAKLVGNTSLVSGKVSNEVSKASVNNSINAAVKVKSPLWKRVLIEGFVIEPEFGRSDDFSWPRD